MKHLAKRVLGMGLALTCALTLALGAKATNAYADDVYDYVVTSSTPNGVFASFTLSEPTEGKMTNVTGLHDIPTKAVVEINGVVFLEEYLGYMSGGTEMEYSFDRDAIEMVWGSSLVYPLEVSIVVSANNESHLDDGGYGPFVYVRLVTFRINDSTYSYGTDEEPQNWLDAEKFATVEAILADVEYTVPCYDVDTLDRELVEILRHSTKTSLELNFTYEGVAHQVVIPAGQAPTEDLDYYGPLWLIKKYGDKLATPTYTKYVVQKGDTLGALAKKWGTTVDVLMALNPQIKDNHWIYIGDTLLH